MDCSSMMVVVGLSLLGAVIADAIASSSAPNVSTRPKERILADAEFAATSTPTIRVVGTVFCDLCHEDRLTKNSRLLSGATVALECKRPKSKHLPSIRIETSTNSSGEFQLELPSSDASSSIKRLRQCKVWLVKSPLKTCRRKTRSSRALAASLSLKSNKETNLVYSAGFLSFQTKSLPELCSTSSGMKAERTKSISWRPESSSVESNQLPSQPIIPTPQLLPPTPGLPWVQPIPGLPQGFPPLPIPFSPIPFQPSAPGFPTSVPSLPPIPFLFGPPSISDSPPLPPRPNLPLPPSPNLPLPPNPRLPPQFLSLAATPPLTHKSSSLVPPKAISPP